MAFDRFLIAPLKTGFETDLKPWLIPDDAFAQLENAYVFRGRVRKRFGETLMGSGWPSASVASLFSRFRINLGNTDGSGNISVSVPGIIFVKGQQFSIGTEIFTVVVTGTPGVMLDTGASTVHTYNTTTGAVVIHGAAATTAVWFYPAQPVMGLTNYEVGDINNFPSYGFDTQFAYVFSGGFWQRSGTVVWNDPTGNQDNYFWSENWSGFSDNLASYNRALFTTNFQVTNPNGAPAVTDDPIYWFDGTTWTAFYAYFAPAGGAAATGPFVLSSRIIVGFKRRLVLLNTIETNAAENANTNFQFRARYSWNGSPFAVNAWYEKNQVDSGGKKFGGAGYVDASTEEQIVSCEFIKDRLIVYFESSTWELAYTSNEVEPFVWQKLNTELGTEATFSSVPFDKEILSIDNVGVHACNGSNVRRIDTKIPDYIFKIFNKVTGVERIAGIRDYYAELVYWTFPSLQQDTSEKFPTRILVYNYRNDSWAVFLDCVTTWGYFQQQPADTWENSLLTWEESDETWSSGSVEQQFRQVIAGNQQGYVFIVNQDIGRNAPVMQITNIAVGIGGATLTIINHTLTTNTFTNTQNTGDFICIENAQGVTGLNNNIYGIIFVDVNTVLAIGATFTGTYTGGGTATRVSNISILSKQWNPYVGQGRDFYLARIDFGVLKTSDGQVTVDYYPSSSGYSMINAGTQTGAIMGNNILETSPYDPVLYPFEGLQTRLWHPLYFQTFGECIQIFINMSVVQMTNPDIVWSDFQLEGLILHTQATSSRLE